MPPVDINRSQPDKSDLGDGTGLDLAEPALLVLGGRDGPRRLVPVGPQVDQLARGDLSGIGAAADGEPGVPTWLASRLVPLTVRLTWVGRPLGSRPVKARTSHATGERSRTVAMKFHNSGVGIKEGCEVESRPDERSAGGPENPIPAASLQSPPAGSGWCPRRSGCSGLGVQQVAPSALTCGYSGASRAGSTQLR